MEPGVPFALLGAVVLLAAASWVALAGAAVALRGSRAGASLVAVGALVLLLLEARNALVIGQAGDDALAPARAAGLLLLAAGLYLGALERTPRPLPTPSATVGVIVPLGTSAGPAVAGVLAGVVAALGALRSRRDVAGALLAAGLLVAGGAVAAGALVDDDGGARLVLGARGVGALLLLAGLVVLARSSLLAKVVAAILAGVLATSVVAVGVVGTTVVRGYEQEQSALVVDAAVGREQLLSQTLEALRADTPVFADACTTAGSEACAAVLAQFGADEDFALLVPRNGDPVVLGGSAPLSPSEALALAGGDLVGRALAGGAAAVRGTEVSGPVRLVGAEPGLALAVVQPLDRPTPTDEAGSAFVYGVRVGQGVVDVDFALDGFGFSVLVDERVVATNLSERGREVVEQAAASSGPLPPDGTTVPAVGDRPTVHLRPLEGEGGTVAVLALSREAEQALASQRQALTTLLLASLATTVAVGAAALLLGRRTVEPVRRLTAAAERVSGGDLAGRTGITGRDEVGTLARAFDTMTGSLSRLTGDLRASAARLETVLASMSDGLLATDADGRVTSVNRAALAMTGHQDAEEVLGRPLAELVDLRGVSGEALPLAAGSPLVDVASEVHAADGTVTPVRAASAPLDDDGGDGSRGGVVLVLRDTTREREVERMKTEFLSNVSHELRTPLTPIRGYADLLSSRPGLPAEKVTSFAGTILAESLKMNRVVDLLVDVAALEAGRVEIRPRAVDVRDLLDARLADWRGRAPARAGDLKRRVTAKLPPVLVDPGWLGKVLDELVDNAVKHTPVGASITLAASPAPDGEHVRVSVRDTGPGFEASEQELLFTSFEQRDGSATRRVGGLGLGLSFVRRVAEDAGWPLHVVPGKGAELAVDLPVSPEPAPAPRRGVRR